MTGNRRTKSTDVESDPYVLRARELRQHVQLESTPRFSDTVWDLSGAVIQTNGRHPSLDFSTVPSAHLPLTKTLCFVGLAGLVPSDEDVPSIATVASWFYRLRTFARWAATRKPDQAMNDLTVDDLAEYNRHLVNRYRNPATRSMYRGVLSLPWRMRGELGEEAGRFDPRRTELWTDPAFVQAGGENSTPRIPEQVHSPLLVWAIRFVDDFSDDILTAVDRWLELRKGSRPAERGQLPKGGSAQLAEEYLQRVRAAGKPLLGHLGQPNLLAMTRAARCGRDAMYARKAEIQELAATFGVTPFTLGTDILGRLNNSPWIEGVSTDIRRADSIAALTAALQAACYVVIAFLSGMRDTEVKHLKPGSCTAVRDRRGKAVRWRLTSLAFKGEAPRGATATWVIGAPAARAVAVLEQLIRKSESSEEWLFAPLRTTSGYDQDTTDSDRTLTTSATNRAVRQLVRWINDYCVANGRTDGIPNVDGQPWPITPGQFRRTLAWYIARRPGGSIAGAIAYRHHSLQMFEGYAGTSDSGFRAEVEAEQALARGEHLMSMVERNEHNQLAGPSADEARRRLQGLKIDGRFAGSVQNDPKRFARLIAQHGPEVYPGKFVTCVFNPDKALCHVANGAPDDTSCKPMTCRNVALTGDNISAWRHELDQITRDIQQRPALPPMLITRLEERQRQVETLLQKGIHNV